VKDLAFAFVLLRGENCCGKSNENSDPFKWWSSGKSLGPRDRISLISDSSCVVAYMMATRGLHGR